MIRAAAIQHHEARTYSIAVINRYQGAAPLAIALGGAPRSAVFRKYVYDTARVPFHPFGDLQPPGGTVPLKNGTLVDRVAPLSLTVYTTDYDNDPPAPVRGVKVEAEVAERRRATWQASVEPDFCYYRIYRGARAGFMPTQEFQVGSTIATEFLDAEAGKAEAHYRVLAVDQSGNASK